MAVHILQHVPFEGPAFLSDLLSPHHPLTVHHLYRGDALPDPVAVQRLIILGGPMGADDEETVPFLRSEKRFIAEVIARGATVLGICLGAQLIARVLGAAVTKNLHREIGWFPVTRHPRLEGSCLGPALPTVFEAFHWHGDTFAIPDGAVPLGSTEACANQGFVFDNRVAGFQFHLEATADSVSLLLAHCGDELDGSPFVRSREEIRGDTDRFDLTHRLMAAVLDVLKMRRASRTSPIAHPSRGSGNHSRI